MIQGTWKNCTIADGQTVSAEVDLGRAYETLLVVVPALANGQLTIQVAEKTGGTFQDLYITDPADGGNNKVISATASTAFTWTVPLGGFQFIKITSSASQSGGDTLRVCGIRS